MPVADGGRIRAGRIFRVSGGLMSADELDALEAAGLRRVVDLRGEDEDRSVLMEWAGKRGVDYVSQPIYAAGRREFVEIARQGMGQERAQEYMTSLYRGIIDEHGNEIAATIGAIADRLPAGYGCAAGKDRTGIVTAFLHVLLGVPEGEAARRYVNGAPSVERLGPLARTYLGLDEGAPLPAEIEVLIRPAPTTLLGMLDHARENYGGVREYLESHGMAPGTAADLRRRLVVPA